MTTSPLAQEAGVREGKSAPGAEPRFRIRNLPVYLILLAGWVNIYRTFDSLRCVHRMQSTENKVACFGGSNCCACCFEISHFADEDNFRVLS